ncbi:hypothetical protein BQ8420_16575 [Nocardiopsis sp. JB363]|nr:hypothetical protein BQ8420_16575 [Nocardiopsis sp. JB363]
MSAPDTTVSEADAETEAPPAQRSTPDTALPEAAAADAATDLARTDATNTTLATLSGVLLTVLTAGAGLTTGDGSYPTLALVAMGTAAALLAAALVVLTTAMWPRRGGDGGVPHYATHTPDTLLAELTESVTARWHAERAVAKARIATRKHIAQRVAGAALAAAGVLLAVATILTLATG